MRQQLVKNWMKNPDVTSITVDILMTDTLKEPLGLYMRSARKPFSIPAPLDISAEAGSCKEVLPHGGASLCPLQAEYGEGC